MHYYFYLSKVQIRKNVLKYSNEVKILRYIPPLGVTQSKPRPGRGQSAVIWCVMVTAWKGLKVEAWNPFFLGTIDPGQAVPHMRDGGIAEASPPQ